MPQLVAECVARLVWCAVPSKARIVCHSCSFVVGLASMHDDRPLLNTALAIVFRRCLGFFSLPSMDLLVVEAERLSHLVVTVPRDASRHRHTRLNLTLTNPMHIRNP